MIINSVLSKFQKVFKPLYDKSIVLKNTDWLIGLNIFLVIFASTIANSDNIGYFAIFAIILTTVKILVKTGEKFELDLEDKFLLLYFIIVLISVAGSSLFYLSLKGFLKTLIYLGFYVSVIYYLKDNKDKIKYIFAAFALCAVYETIIAFIQNFASVGEISGWQDMSRLNPEEVMTRVYGTLKPFNPNLFGGYMLSVIPAILTLPFINKKTAILSLVCFAFAVAALVFTGCRGAYIGLFFEIVILVAFTYKYLENKFKKAFTAIVGFITLIISFIIVSVASLRARVLSIFAMRSDSSNSFRFNVYNSCIQMFKDNWLLGIGCGNQNFREIYGLYMKTGFDALSAYNIYLETAVESGIFALLSFISFIFIRMYKACRYVLNSNAADKFFVLACVLSVAGMLAHGIVDTVFFRPQIQFTFWIMIGIIRTVIKG